MIRAVIAASFAATLTLAGGYALGQGGNQSVPTYNIQNAWPSKIPPHGANPSGAFTTPLAPSSPSGLTKGGRNYVPGYFSMDLDGMKTSTAKKIDGGNMKAEVAKEKKQPGSLVTQQTTEGVIAIPDPGTRSGSDLPPPKK
jgi:hypothetical protein